MVRLNELVTNFIKSSHPETRDIVVRPFKSSNGFAPLWDASTSLRICSIDVLRSISSSIQVLAWDLAITPTRRVIALRKSKK